MRSTPALHEYKKGFRNPDLQRFVPVKNVNLERIISKGVQNVTAEDIKPVWPDTSNQEFVRMIKTFVKELQVEAQNTSPSARSKILEPADVSMCPELVVLSPSGVLSTVTLSPDTVITPAPNSNWFKEYNVVSFRYSNFLSQIGQNFYNFYTFILLQYIHTLQYTFSTSSPRNFSTFPLKFSKQNKNYFFSQNTHFFSMCSKA